MRKKSLRILFSSDLHALKPAFVLFAKTLAEGPYRAGVLEGDLLDHFWLPERYLVERFGVDPDELIEELPGDEDPLPSGAGAGRRSELNRLALLATEAEFKAILASAGKPVFLVPGNHDTTPWADEGPVVNLDGRRVEWEGLNLVGSQKPLWHLFGHVHSRFGSDGRSVNGAYPCARSFFDIDLVRGRISSVPAEVPLEPRVPQ